MIINGGKFRMGTPWPDVDFASGPKTELVKILISGNQCIYRDAELNDVHDTQVNIPG